MRLFLDTNVILDILENREPFVHDAVRLFEMQKSGQATLVVTDLTIVNIAYITRKTCPVPYFYTVLSKLRPFLEIVPLGAEVIDHVVASQPKDFEDGAQYFAAIRSKADFIITRNKKDFPFSEIPVYTPTEFLLKYNSI